LPSRGWTRNSDVIPGATLSGKHAGTATPASNSFVWIALREASDSDRGARPARPCRDASRNVRSGPMSIGTFAALRHRDYRLFFVGQLITVIGRNMRMVAAGWLVYDLTGDPFLLGLVSGLGSLPMFVLPTFAGAIADRLNKRRMLLVVEVISAIPPLVLAYLVWTGTVQVWQVAALSFVSGVTHAFEMPTRHSFVIDMVGRKDLMNAIALNSTLFSSARVIGPAIAGFVIDAFNSTAPCFLITGIGFSAIIIALVMVRVDGRESKIPQDRDSTIVDGVRHTWFRRIVSGIVSIVNSVVDAVRYACSRRIVIGTLGVLIMVMVFAASYSVLLPVFARDIFHRGARELGFLTTSAGLGAVFGALTVASLLW